MMKKRGPRLSYGVDLDTGTVISRNWNAPSETALAWPILDYKGMTPENGFSTRYFLEHVEVWALRGVEITWTRKVPTEIKNQHRVFWGMKPLPTPKQTSVRTP